MQCKSEMGDKIDVEEHNIFDNPQLRKVFPDITQLKQELREGTPKKNVETCISPRTVKIEEGEYDIINSNAATDINLLHTCKVELDKSISETDKSVPTNVEANNQNTQFYIEISANAYDAFKEEQTEDEKVECALVPKNEIITCRICCKESGEEICKQCVLESEEGSTLYTPLDGTLFHGTDNNKKAPEITIAQETCTYTSVDRSALKQKLQKHIRDKSYRCNNKISSDKISKPHVKSKHKNIFCAMCEYRCLSKSRLIRHLRTHTGEKPFKCDLCEQMFSESWVLKKHIKAKHTNERNYFCDICKYKSVTKNDLDRHLRTHTGEKPYKCDLCDYTYSRGTHLKNHIRAKHTNEKNYSCTMCEYVTVTKSNLNQHLRIHTGEKPYKCDLCDYTCARGSHLKNHVSAKHTNEKNYSCYMCDYKSVTKSRLNEHFRKHTGETPYKCALCDCTFSRSDYLRNHAREKHTNEKNYSCTMCEYKTVTKGSLNKHIQRHTGEKPYICHLCEHTFTRGSDLKYHIKAKHTNEKNYSCNMCEYKSVRKSRLNEHLRRHAPENPSKCDSSDYTYSQGDLLKPSVRDKHLDVRHYSCTVCEFKTFTKSNLNKHIQTHSGEKPFKCDLCEHTCLRGSDLKNHIKAKHTNEKNYSCNTCEYKAVKKSNLIRHIRKHTGEKPYRCDLCDYRTSESFLLKKHTRTKHKSQNAT